MKQSSSVFWHCVDALLSDTALFCGRASDLRSVWSGGYAGVSHSEHPPPEGALAKSLCNPSTFRYPGSPILRLPLSPHGISGTFR